MSKRAKKIGRPLRLVACLFILLTAASLVAHAHARLDHSTPAAGSILRVATKEVVVWFTQDLEPSFSTMLVHDSEGVRVDQEDAHVDRDNKKVMRVSLKPLAAGTYKVTWNVLSVDTHKTDGSFEFRIMN
jgi:methionine-rich copper-binding protein CopC